MGPLAFQEHVYFRVGRYVHTYLHTSKHEPGRLRVRKENHDDERATQTSQKNIEPNFHAGPRIKY